MSELNLDIIEDSTNILVKLSGRLIYSNVYSLLNRVGCIDGFKSITIDCTHLNHIDGSGVQAISMVISRASKLNHYYSITGLSGQPKNLFSYLGVSRLINRQDRGLIPSILTLAGVNR